MWLEENVTVALINPIIPTKTRHFRHAHHPTRDSVLLKEPEYLARHNDSKLDGRSRNQGSILDVGKRFLHSVQTGSGAHPAS
jgi:hypothetical protein